MNTSLYIPEEWKEPWKRARAEAHRRSYEQGRNVPVAEVLLENYKEEKNQKRKGTGMKAKEIERIVAKIRDELTLEAYTDADLKSMIVAADDHNIDPYNISHEIAGDYLTLNKARNGRYAVWYVDERTNWAQWADTGKELTKSEITKQLA